jgi:hypothetical protein
LDYPNQITVAPFPGITGTPAVCFFQNRRNPFCLLKSSIFQLFTAQTDTLGNTRYAEWPGHSGKNFTIALVGQAVIASREDHPYIWDSGIPHYVTAHLPADFKTEIAVDNDKIRLEVVDNGRTVVLAIRDLKVEPGFFGMIHEIVRQLPVVRNDQDIGFLPVHLLVIAAIVAMLAAENFWVMDSGRQLRHFVATQGAQLINGAVHASFLRLSVAVVFPTVLVTEPVDGVGIFQDFPGNRHQPFQIAPVDPIVSSGGPPGGQVSRLDPFEYGVTGNRTQGRSFPCCYEFSIIQYFPIIRFIHLDDSQTDKFRCQQKKPGTWRLICNDRRHVRGFEISRYPLFLVPDQRRDLIDGETDQEPVFFHVLLIDRAAVSSPELIDERAVGFLPGLRQIEALAPVPFGAHLYWIHAARDSWCG